VSTLAEIQPTRRERRKLEVQAKITEAAAELFACSGCEDITVEEICERADVARKTFYNYFQSKQQLIHFLSQSVLTDEPRQTMDEAIATFATTAERLSYFFSHMRKNLIEYRELERTLILHSMFQLSENASSGGSQIMAQNSVILELYQLGLERGDVTTDYGIEFLAEITVGSINSIIINWIHVKDYPLVDRLSELEDYLKAMICRP
jgi:AcrR family transcriptional regulator